MQQHYSTDYSEAEMFFAFFVKVKSTSYDLVEKVSDIYLRHDWISIVIWYKVSKSILYDLYNIPTSDSPTNRHFQEFPTDSPQLAGSWFCSRSIGRFLAIARGTLWSRDPERGVKDIRIIMMTSWFMCKYICGAHNICNCILNHAWENVVSYIYIYVICSLVLYLFHRLYLNNNFGNLGCYPANEVRFYNISPFHDFHRWNNSLDRLIWDRKSVV